MQIKIKNQFVKENIVDEEGNILGEIKFNPNDSRIMFKLSKIVNDLTGYLKKIKDFGDMPKISKNNLENLEDFENASKDFSKIHQAFEIEETAVSGVIEDLTSIFGKETIEIFTGGTKDIYSLMPLLEFIMPYVKKAREKKVSKYIKNKKDDELDVLE